MTRKVIEAGTAETVGLRAKHESAGPAEQDAPNTMADLRLAYARIREALEPFARYLDALDAMIAFHGGGDVADKKVLHVAGTAGLTREIRMGDFRRAREALKATHLIGLEGERGLDTVDTLAPGGIDREFLRQQIAADPDIETEARIGLSQGEGE